MSADPLELFDRLRTPPEWSGETDLDVDRVAAEILERVFAGRGNVISLDVERRRRRVITGTVVVAALAADRPSGSTDSAEFARSM